MVQFQNIGSILQTYAISDFFLPFILVFTVVFAILQKTKILGEKKNFNVVVSLVLGLVFVVPHLTGGYPLNYDPVVIMNQVLPSIALVAIASIMLLVLMGVFGTDFSTAAAPFIAILAIAFVIYTFGSSLGFWVGPYDIFSWWTPEITELVIMILVFGVVVYAIVHEPKEKSSGGEMMKSFGKLFTKK
jgi:hypothetical protein